MIWKTERRGTEDAYYLQTMLFGPIRASIVEAQGVNRVAPFYLVIDGMPIGYYASVEEAKRLGEFLIRSEERVS